MNNCKINKVLKKHSIGEINRIKKLETDTMNKCFDFLAELDRLEIGVIITSTYRDFDSQLDLWREGRNAFGKIVDRGKVVTHAFPGFSFHNYALAFDIWPVKFDKITKVRVSDVEKANWSKISEIAKDIGLTWGGDFKNISDKCHFQNTHDITVEQFNGMQARFFENNTLNHFRSLCRGGKIV